MRISIVNQSKITDSDVNDVLRAINRQLIYDFRQSWDILAEARLEGARSKRITRAEIRGDAIIYLREGDGEREQALGYHDVDKFGLPWGVVFTETSEPWETTLSHEVLETCLDPHCNRLALGPHPTQDRDVFHWYEVADACQADHYDIDGIQVTDFVLPGYFTPGEEKGMRNTFCGRKLESFGVATGGYVGYFDPVLGEHRTYAADDLGIEAADRAMLVGRRGARYMRVAA